MFWMRFFGLLLGIGLIVLCPWNKIVSPLEWLMDRIWMAVAIGTPLAVLAVYIEITVKGWPTRNQQSTG